MQEVAARPEGKTTKQTRIIITIKRVKREGVKGRESESVRHTDRETHTNTTNDLSRRERKERRQRGVKKYIEQKRKTKRPRQVLESIKLLVTMLIDDVEVLLYVHRNRTFVRDGSPGRPPRLSHSS